MRSLVKVLIAAVCLAAAVPGVAAAQTPMQGISVIGEAEAFADNDIGTFRFGVSARRPTAAAALRSASAAVQRVVGAVRASGVAREDVQTDVINVSRSPTKRHRRSWVARNAVTVTVRRLAESGVVVDRAVGAGATSVEGPSLGVADIRSIYRRTLAAAYEDARAKAEGLAAIAGVRLGAPLRVRESGADDFEERLVETSGGSDDEAASPQQSAPVEGGRRSVSAFVYVTFAVAAP